MGMGENAGVVDIGDGWAATFKIESHNHPSYVEPHQGAATGVGGIVRDIMSMGARPIAVMDALRFGGADQDDTRRVLPGVVEGISHYGNCLGLPNIGGEVVFDPCYIGNPLVNALCVGLLRKDQIKLAVAPGPGNKVVLFGASTGPDGIGGASVLAAPPSRTSRMPSGPPCRWATRSWRSCSSSAAWSSTPPTWSWASRTSARPGVSCATTELAAKGTGGMHVDLNLVPLRDPSLVPEEILMSESQERMMAVVRPADIDAFMAICERWDVPATVIGEVTDTGRLVMTWNGETIVDIPPGTAADEGPVYERPLHEPAGQVALNSDTPDGLARPADLRATLLQLLGSPNLASKEWVTGQYDRYVRSNTVLAQPADAGMLRISEAIAGAEPTTRGIALSTDGNGRYAKLDPYAGAQLALAEAYRNVAVTGAKPLAVTNCLNFGSPEDPEVMWQFAEAVRGLADACRTLGVPVTGGNVSFYNQTGSTPIHPTPVVGVLGVIDDVAKRVPTGFTGEGLRVALLGETSEEFGGSEWAHVVHGHLGGLPPQADLVAEQALGAVLVEAARRGLLEGSHDLSDGGLAIALAESCLARGVGATVALSGEPFTDLFSESASRALVVVRPESFDEFAALCFEHEVPCYGLGVTGGTSLVVEDVLEVPVEELRATHTGTLPALFG